MARLESSYARGILTNGPLVREFEDRVAERLNVQAAVAVSSCTSGLMLAIRALDLTGSVVLPSFTFSATAHALAWNGMSPRFAECRLETMQLDVCDVRERVDGAAAIVATHVFGAPCDIDDLEEVAAASKIPLVFDAAHAFGASHRGGPVGGFGAAEIFSLSPTKPLIAGEGGLVTTNDVNLAHEIRLGRDYGNPGDYNTQFVGLNARMSEFHAAIALESLERLDDHLAVRRSLAERYSLALADVPGVQPQIVADTDVSTFKDFTVRFDDEFGLTRDVAAAGLAAEGLDTRKYFSPPVHRQRAYADGNVADLPRTDDVASRVLSLPFHFEVSDREIERVREALLALHRYAGEVNLADSA